ncbi:MAG: TIGR03364 family FAD-dependent oxidoreductase, partial [Actinobacteria bacterium]|nr:TIGR03364 family FAD-dependent oxidoreductase [Actinomycetota bacterium]
MTSSRLGAEVDLAVVGAGIVGLAHAVAAVERGLSVAVIERDDPPVGASVRNFGHCCLTAQDGTALRYGLYARGIWQRLAKEAGFWLAEAGTVVVARSDDELAVLDEFARLRGPDQAVLLDSGTVLDRVPVSPAGVVGGAWLPLDLRVDPRSAAPAIARWLAEQGVTFHWGTTAGSLEPGSVWTSRGPLRARHTVVAVGHDVDRLFPDVAAAAGLRRCSLHMLRVRPTRPMVVEPAVFTGFSLLRYDGFAVCPSRDVVWQRLAGHSPRLLEAGLNLMFTQLPDGDRTVGDTHAYSTTVSPFRAEELDDLVRTEIGGLLGPVELT